MLLCRPPFPHFPLPFQFFFFNDTATTEIYTLSLHDALPISAAMRQLLADDPALDAVFVASDLMADGALRALRHAGRRVPDDVAVIGFDDNEIARYTEPPLTTVRQPVIEIGRTMARQLLRLAAGETVEHALVLPTELVVRESA